MEEKMRNLAFMILCTIFLMTSFMLSHATANKSCINVDQASAKELVALKGVGEKTAANIVKYRKQMRAKATKEKKAKWNFNNWKTLLKVSGMSDTVCKKNIDKVCFANKTTPQKSCPKVEKK